MLRPKEFSLETLAGGALALRIQEELEKLLRNIDDPNTEPETERKLVITLAFKPSKTRNAAAVKASVVVKPAPHAPLETDTYIAIDRRGGRMVITEHNPLQRELPVGDEPEDTRPGSRPS